MTASTDDWENAPWQDSSRNNVNILSGICGLWVVEMSTRHGLPNLSAYRVSDYPSSRIPIALGSFGLLVRFLPLLLPLHGGLIDILVPSNCASPPPLRMCKSWKIVGLLLPLLRSPGRELIGRLAHKICPGSEFQAPAALHVA
jgi:hypothetical protein